jgi:hypothetical protein
VRKHCELVNGINRLGYSLLTGGLGTWLLKEMVHYAPKQVVKVAVTEEANLTKELREHIWNDEDKRDSVLADSLP